MKTNKLTYENGYDLDGELGAFLDAVEGERGWDEFDEDRDLPSRMCSGSDSGSVASSTISKGANESFSDDGSGDYGEKGETGGLY